MKWLTKTWKWLDRKKTAIGTISLIASEIVPDPTVSSILKGIGVLFGGVGVLHKTVKKDFTNNEDNYL